MKSKIKKMFGAILIFVSGIVLWFAVGYDLSKSLQVNIGCFLPCLIFIFCVLACIAVFWLGYILVCIEEPQKEQPPAPQKEPIVEGDITLESYYNFIMYAQKEGCYADRIPKCLQADFKAFMVGRTMQTEGHRSWVYPADMKLYANKLLYKGIDYPVQFKTE